MDPDPIRAEDAAAPGDELLEDILLLGGELVRREVEKAAHDGVSSLGFDWLDGGA
jgi:hypothetical protein